MPRMIGERLPERSIPDRSTGHAFIAIAHPGWRGHTKLCKAGVVAWYRELARRILPRPTPTPAGGQAPALHFLIPPSTIGLQIGTFRRWRAGIEVDWRARFRTNDECEGIPTDAGMTNSVAGTIHPGSECFRTNSAGGAGTPRYENEI